MEKNKSEQYTFGVEEKEILNILSSFEKELEQINKSENTELRYYNNFTLKGESIQGLTNMFITIEKDENGNHIHYNLYTPDMKKILSSDTNGKITECIDELEQVLGKLNIKKLIEENEVGKDGKTTGRLKGISEKAEPQKIEKMLKRNKEESKESEQEEQIQEDIGGEEDLQISYYRPIKDNSFGKQMGMNLNQYGEIGLAFSKTKQAFILVGQKNQKFEMVDGFEMAQPTYKTVLSIDEKGEKVKKEVPHAIMETNDTEKELSITIEQYGYIEVGTIDRLPCDARVQRQVGELGEGENGRTEPELNRVIETEGIESLHKWVHKNKENHEQMEKGEEREGDISEEISQADNDEYIPGTNVTWQEFANKCGYRGEDGIKYAKKIFEEERENNENEGKTNEELVEEVITEKEEGYPSPQQTY